MQMKAPVHPGELVIANLEALGVSVTGAAKAMRVSRQQLQRVVRGQSGVSPQLALRFEQAFGGSADLWMRMQAAYDLAVARRSEEGQVSIPRLVERPALGDRG